ncbi:uncharacterized protein LOC132739934 isoform X2 [Ruditapes philippinarum]|uniref:uncharacterized protein LOC132739934 isoform X2 n=1 Tax=Ruditapes philippinarum TaxID=129788 RepID=UPI00295B5317|nr:uncharacterized protein LOC132739934 isoform X2 [Ruditapes philippinarum]
MAENDNLIAELNRAWKCLDGAIKESLASKRDTLILQREDGSKILQCIEKSRMRFEEGQPSGTKKRMTSSHGKRKSVYVYMSVPGRFAIAVINMTREDSLPRLPIETRLDQPTDDYNNIHFIDMAFTKDNLMYDCNMNKTAREKIKSFVNNMYQQERSEGTCVAS